MPIVDYLPVATGVSANVDSQADFAGSGYQIDGFTAGIAQPNQANKIWRQATMVSACIANFIANVSSINVLDDGNLSALVAAFTAAVAALAGFVAAPSVTVVTFTAIPTWTCPGKTVVNFEMTLTGNVTGGTLASAIPGQLLVFELIQDATGGRTFAWPTGVPGADIDPTPNYCTTQVFTVGSTGIVRATGAPSSNPS